MRKIVKLDIDQLESGMQLAADAMDTQGVCLLTVGQILSKNLIEGLRKRNINQISVYENQTLTPEQTQHEIERITKELDISFSLLAGDKYFDDLKEIFLRFRTRNLEQGNE